jgi:hypothetical protein
VISKKIRDREPDAASRMPQSLRHQPAFRLQTTAMVAVDESMQSRRGGAKNYASLIGETSHGKPISCRHAWALYGTARAA